MDKTVIFWVLFVVLMAAAVVLFVVSANKAYRETMADFRRARKARRREDKMVSEWLHSQENDVTNKINQNEETERKTNA
jgi:Sec-independent protein translocase protein TatA